MYLEKSDTQKMTFYSSLSKYLNSITKAQNIVSLFRITLNPRKKNTKISRVQHPSLRYVIVIFQAVGRRRSDRICAGLSGYWNVACVLAKSGDGRKEERWDYLNTVVSRGWVATPQGVVGGRPGVSLPSPLVIYSGHLRCELPPSSFQPWRTFVWISIDDSPRKNSIGT